MNESKVNELHRNLKKILPDYGVCRFAELENCLLSCRIASKLPAGANSVIAAVFPYLLPDKYYKNRNVARFASVPDYHKVIIKRLEAACEILRQHFRKELFVPFTDNSPIPEKPTALLCGLGALGQNSLFIHPRWGSWVFLGCIVSTIDTSCLLFEDTESTSPEKNLAATKCIQCGKCVSACPVGAISGGETDKSRCLSFLSQRRDANREELAVMSGVLWGCDICQEVCPMNSGVPAEALEEFTLDSQPRFDPSASERVWGWRFLH